MITQTGSLLLMSVIRFKERYGREWCHPHLRVRTSFWEKPFFYEDIVGVHEQRVLCMGMVHYTSLPPPPWLPPKGVRPPIIPFLLSEYSDDHGARPAYRIACPWWPTHCAHLPGGRWSAYMKNAGLSSQQNRGYSTRRTEALAYTSPLCPFSSFCWRQCLISCLTAHSEFLLLARVSPSPRGMTNQVTLFVVGTL